MLIYDLLRYIMIFYFTGKVQQRIITGDISARNPVYIKCYTYACLDNVANIHVCSTEIYYYTYSTRKDGASTTLLWVDYGVHLSWADILCAFTTNINKIKTTRVYSSCIMYGGMRTEMYVTVYCLTQDIVYRSRKFVSYGIKANI
jgi:hypothetical protein